MFNTLTRFARLLPTQSPRHWKNINSLTWRNGSNFPVLQNTNRLPHLSALKFPVAEDNAGSCRSIAYTPLSTQPRIRDVIPPLDIHLPIYVPTERNGSNFTVLQNTNRLPHISALKFPVTEDNAGSCRSILHASLSKQPGILDDIRPLDTHCPIYVPSGVPLTEIIEGFIHPKIEKKAVRIITIRRRKMKKHKLQKLRKKMKFEWAKHRNRRETLKEKAFHAELISQIKAADNFNATEYVSAKLQKLHQYTLSSSDKSYSKNS